MKAKFLLPVLLSLFMLGCQSTTVSPQLLDSLELKNPKQPVDGLITGGQPNKNDLALLKDSGIKTIINLRGDDEFKDFDEASVAKAMGFNYISLPISSLAELNRDNAEKLDQLLEQNDDATFLHCGSGNRVGALMALREFYIKGKSADEALRFGEASGMTRLKKEVEKLIDNK